MKSAQMHDLFLTSIINSASDFSKMRELGSKPEAMKLLVFDISHLRDHLPDLPVISIRA